LSPHALYEVLALRQAVFVVEQQCPYLDPVRIQAQAYLQRFYESFGFGVVGEPYLEDNIPHVDMLLDMLRSE